MIAGVVVVESAADLRHEGLTLTLDGAVSLTLSAKHVGIFDAFSNNIRVVISFTYLIAWRGLDIEILFVAP